jgi:hypothetical protein
MGVDLSGPNSYVPDSTGIEAGDEVDVYVIGDLLG